MVIPHAVRFFERITGYFAGIGLYWRNVPGRADTLARTLLTPAEIPVGIVTALAVAFFIYLDVEEGPFV
jgi:ABC-type Fe3+-siderophore transport system permease subunit